MEDVIIVVSGGVVQDVYVTNRENIAVTLIDFDNFECEEDSEISRDNYPAWDMVDNDWLAVVKDIVGDDATVLED